MIYIVSPGNKQEARHVVQAALGRSFTDAMVSDIALPLWKNKLAELKKAPSKAFFLVLVDPLASWVELLIETYETTNAKILLLGEIPPEFATYCQASSTSLTDDVISAGHCDPAPSFGLSESALAVTYQQGIGESMSPISHRPFLRYDFTDEWNNLGYGAIRVDASIWALSAITQVPDEVSIASVVNNETDICSYAALWDNEQSSLLWFNRSVGPVDSAEWCLVEAYFGDYRAAELPCVPYLSEIPYGYESAVTMRLDCDEDIESARPLWEAYQQMDVPLSLAIHTKVLTDESQYQLPHDVLAKGGALLSHTETHAPDWGGSYEAALGEGRTSLSLIKDKLGCHVRYAVSPFHQTPLYARDALADVGYAGCIGGIIRNDPDFLMARSGRPPFAAKGFIGHSQQCMLHGESMLSGDEPLSVFKQAFDIAYKSQTFFGYLDHPFSSRYQYGWDTEEQRIAAHQVFIAYMKGHDGVLFANENDAMDFLSHRAEVNIQQHGQSYTVSSSAATIQTKWPVSIGYKGLTYSLDAKEVTL